MSEVYSKTPAQADEFNETIDSLAPADAFDSVIEAYKKDVDRTILRENLRLSPQERSEKFISFMKSVWALRRVAQESKHK